MSEELKYGRRSFLGAAAMTIAAAELAMIGSAHAHSSKITPADITPTKPATIRPGANPSFGLLKQIDAGALNIGYAERGERVPVEACPFEHPLFACVMSNKGDARRFFLSLWVHHTSGIKS